MNRYGYAFNNPLSFTDPSGWWPNGYQHKDPPEDYNEPYSYAPTGGGDVYYRLNRWYNGPSDPFAGMGFDFEGKMHDAYINTINARPPEAGPSRQLVDLYFESGAAEEGVSYGDWYSDPFTMIDYYEPDKVRQKEGLIASRRVPVSINYNTESTWYSSDGIYYSPSINSVSERRVGSIDYNSNKVDPSTAIRGDLPIGTFSREQWKRNRDEVSTYHNDGFDRWFYENVIYSEVNRWNCIFWHVITKPLFLYPTPTDIYIITNDNLTDAEKILLLKIKEKGSGY